MKDILKSLLYIVLLIIFFWGLRYTQIRDSKKLEQNGIYTTGEVIGFDKKGNPVWEYTKNGDIIEIRNRTMKKLKGMQRGEKFKAKYDPNYSKNASIFFEYPIILESNLDTLYDYNIINMNKRYIIFEYEISDKKVIREQKIPKNEIWGVNRKYIVLISTQNDLIGYLYPIKSE